MVDWYLGTMGFSYKDWDGVFYPAGMDSRNYLAYYSQVFNAAEVDSTFYGTPRRSVIQRWVAITPKDFKFCVKTPQIITHNLATRGALSEMAAFLEAVREFGEKLGVILIQFPPSFRFEQFNILSGFIAEIINGRNVGHTLPFAVEFRHPSWYASNDEIQKLFVDYGICWAATEYPGLPIEIYLTTFFLYIRWIGKHGSYIKHDHERVDRSPQLAGWWEHLQLSLPQLGAVYGFFNNDYAGFAAATCNRFKAIAGLPVPKIPSVQQGKLF